MPKIQGTMYITDYSFSTDSSHRHTYSHKSKSSKICTKCYAPNIDSKRACIGCSFPIFSYHPKSNRKGLNCMSQSKSTNKPSSQSTGSSAGKPELPTTGTNVTFFLAKGQSGRYFASPALWKTASMDLPGGKTVEVSTVQNGQNGKSLPSNCPSSVLLPTDFEPSAHGALEDLRVNWNSITENVILFVQS